MMTAANALRYSWCLWRQRCRHCAAAAARLSLLLLIFFLLLLLLNQRSVVPLRRLLCRLVISLDSFPGRCLRCWNSFHQLDSICLSSNWHCCCCWKFISFVHFFVFLMFDTPRRMGHSLLLHRIQCDAYPFKLDISISLWYTSKKLQSHFHLRQRSSNWLFREYSSNGRCNYLHIWIFIRELANKSSCINNCRNTFILR